MSILPPYKIIVQKGPGLTWRWQVLKRGWLFLSELNKGSQCRSREDALDRAESVVQRDRERIEYKREVKRSREAHYR